MHQLTDYELMLFVKLKRQEALSVLYDRFASLVYSYAFRAVRDEQAAREIVQSVFVRLWTTDSDYSEDKGKYTNWLITITRNITIDWLRKQRRQSEGIVPITAEQMARIPDDEGDSPEASIERESIKGQIRVAYRYLSGPQIELLEHFYWQGFTLRELAARYGEPLGTVKNRLHQALKILRRHLALEGE